MIEPNRPEVNDDDLVNHHDHPSGSSFQSDTIPEELKARDCWVLWRYEVRDGKRTKVPYCVYDPRKRADTSDPQTWDSFGAALHLLRELEGTSKRCDGIGRVFSHGEGLTGVDLDYCLGPRGQLMDWAVPFYERLKGSYCEISPSGKGLKFWVKAELPGRGVRRTGFGPDGTGAIEIYDAGRYFTVTGEIYVASWTTVEDRQDAIDLIYQEVAFHPGRNGDDAPCGPPCAGDEELLAKAREAKNGVAFRRLFDEGELPNGDWSRGDFQLCCRLAFWFNRDAEAIDRVFRASKLWREKWDEPRRDSTYGAQTIDKAIGVTSEVYRAPRAKRKKRANARAGGGESGAQDRPHGGGEGDASSKPTQAQMLLSLAEGVALFRAPDDKLFASLRTGDHLENHPIKGSQFRRWLTLRYFETTGQPPGAEAMQQALTTLEAMAQFRGEAHTTWIRVAAGGTDREPEIFLDLGDQDWTVVRITAQGWDLLPVGVQPVKFRRAKGMLALPVPTRGGSVDALRPFLNIASDDEWKLVVAFLTAALRPRGPYPVLVLNGEQGCCKSWTTKLIKLLVDPHTTPLRSEPKENRDLMIAANNSWMLAYDNMSSLYNWLSDAFCRLATGGGFSIRALYENDEEIHFNAIRPVFLNGVENFVVRGDLLDRSIVLDLPRVPDDKRKREELMMPVFEAARPAILGALLDAVAGGLRELPNVQVPALPRMADFYAWAIAVGKALGWDDDAVLKAYQNNRGDATLSGLEASVIAQYVIRFARAKGTWEGTALQLLKLVEGIVEERILRDKAWPKNAQAFSGRLRRDAPMLREAGIEVTFLPRTNNIRPIILTCIDPEKKGETSSPSSSSRPDADDAMTPPENMGETSSRSEHRHRFDATPFPGNDLKAPKTSDVVVTISSPSGPTSAPIDSHQHADQPPQPQTSSPTTSLGDENRNIYTQKELTLSPNSFCDAMTTVTMFPPPSRGASLVKNETDEVCDGGDDVSPEFSGDCDGGDDVSPEFSGDMGRCGAVADPMRDDRFHAGRDELSPSDRDDLSPAGRDDLSPSGRDDLSPIVVPVITDADGEVVYPARAPAPEPVFARGAFVRDMAGKEGEVWRKLPDGRYSVLLIGKDGLRNYRASDLTLIQESQ
jgi:hypothetical protein